MGTPTAVSGVVSFGDSTGVLHLLERHSLPLEDRLTVSQRSVAEGVHCEQHQNGSAWEAQPSQDAT